jgi:hypothetical protein
MTIKEELHSLVEDLDEDRASEALLFLRRLVQTNGGTSGSVEVDLRSRMRGRVVWGKDFFEQVQPDLETLAAQQGVGPVANFDDLLGDFWPDDESVDEFLTTIRAWRREGDHA